MTAARLYRAERYIANVLEGKINTCKWVKLACQRHVDDLENSAARGLYFDRSAAIYAEQFFAQVLRHPKNSIRAKVGAPFKLEPWQLATIIWPLFGWKRADGSRRFRRGFVGIPKKNGKSSISAGIADLLVFADREYSAEVFSVAGSRDQAKIIFDISSTMAESAPDIQVRCEIYKRSIIYKDTHSVYRVLSADVPTAHGINAHGILFDELHVQPNRLLFDALWGAGKARRQPLFLMLTTAGYDRQSVCFEIWEYAQNLLEKTIPADDSFWGVIYTMDEGDDWLSPKIWRKANPNLGVTVGLNSITEEARLAAAIPGYQNTFKRLTLNTWTEQESRLITAEMWNSGQVAPVERDGQGCYGGLDLAATSDIAAFVLDFLLGEEGGHFWLPFFWLPKENLEERGRATGVNYETWARDGFLRLTEGNVIDLGVIKRDIEELGQIYNIKQIAFDRWGAREISQELQDMGFQMVEFGQGFKSMAAPTKEFLRLTVAGKLHHDGHPVLRWMANNLTARQDSAGNMKPDKEKSRQKIDGIVAGIMALDLALRHEDDDHSVYETRGLIKF